MKELRDYYLPINCRLQNAFCPRRPFFRFELLVFRGKSLKWGKGSQFEKHKTTKCGEWVMGHTEVSIKVPKGKKEYGKGAGQRK